MMIVDTEEEMPPASASKLGCTTQFTDSTGKQKTCNHRSNFHPKSKCLVPGCGCPKHTPPTPQTGIPQVVFSG
jgi:hypothetical protein